jgi:hypothetical protein
MEQLGYKVFKAYKATQVLMVQQELRVLMVQLACKEFKATQVQMVQLACKEFKEYKVLQELQVLTAQLELQV